MLISFAAEGLGMLNAEAEPGDLLTGPDNAGVGSAGLTSAELSHQQGVGGQRRPLEATAAH